MAYSTQQEASAAMSSYQSQINACQKDIRELEKVRGEISALKSDMEKQNENRWGAFRRLGSIFDLLGVLLRPNSLMNLFKQDLQNDILGSSYNSVHAGLKSALNKIDNKIDELEKSISSLRQAYNNAATEKRRIAEEEANKASEQNA